MAALGEAAAACPAGPAVPSVPAAAPGAAPAVSLARSPAEARRAARTRMLLEAPIPGTLAKLAAPNVIAMATTAATSIAEGYFAGLIGVSALAGLALAFPFVMLTQMLSAGAMGGAISSAVARALGAGDAARADRLLLHAVVIGVGFAALTAALMGLFGATLFRLLGGGEAALPQAMAYAAVFFPGCICHWLCNAQISAIRGTGNMFLPALALFCAAAGSIPIGGALALGWGPFPALGMAGLAAGQVSSFGLAGLGAFAYIASGRAGFSLTRAFGRLQAALFADILRVGLMAALSTVQTVLTIVVMVGLVGRFGETALAGYGLGARLEFLMVPVVFGIGAAMTAMVGANVGAGRKARALRVAWTGSLAAAALVGGIGALVAAAPDLWLGLFLGPEDTEALAAGRLYFRTVGPFYAFFALGLALYFASQGAGRVFWPSVAGFARLALAVGGGALLSGPLGGGLGGVFAAIAAGMLAYGVLTAAAIRLGAWGR
ncbi:MAG: MATE family efflux transporter [Pseudomonadota bacterium]|nr:MATE family efflux transporter [Pseudomonadota bacterium]